MTNIRDDLDRWAKWRRHRTGLGYPRRTLLGRCIDDMPKTTCNLCRGDGLLPGSATTTCPRCNGKGRISGESSPSKINPALIHSTRYDTGNAKMEKLDKIMSSLRRNDHTIKYWLVVYFEYCRSGTQEMKAARLGKSQQYFSKTLREAYDLITDSLGEKKRAKSVTDIFLYRARV